MGLITLRDAAAAPLGEVLDRLNTSADGLDTVEADRRRQRDGANVLAEHRVTAAAVLIRQLRNPLLILLVGAAAVSIATGDSTGGTIIVSIVLLITLLGVDNLIVVQTEDALLVANRSEADQIKKLVDLLPDELL